MRCAIVRLNLAPEDTWRAHPSQVMKRIKAMDLKERERRGKKKNEKIRLEDFRGSRGGRKSNKWYAASFCRLSDRERAKYAESGEKAQGEKVPEGAQTAHMTTMVWNEGHTHANMFCIVQDGGEGIRIETIIEYLNKVEGEVWIRRTPVVTEEAFADTIRGKLTKKVEMVVDTTFSTDSETIKKAGVPLRQALEAKKQSNRAARVGISVSMGRGRVFGQLGGVEWLSDRWADLAGIKQLRVRVADADERNRQTLSLWGLQAEVNIKDDEIEKDEALGFQGTSKCNRMYHYLKRWIEEKEGE